jgi:hypothetical protein
VETKLTGGRHGRRYRQDRLGSGYVQLWGFGATIERLPAIRADGLL